jgi:hypothetical protein
MRLHTKLTADDLFDALRKVKDAGRMTGDVTFDPITAYRSQTHPRAYEIQLGALNGGGLPAGYTNQYGKRQKCRRTRNSNRGDSLHRFSATWHEWGWFIALLYRADPDARWGDRKMPVYKDRDDFHNKTHGDFAGVLING